MCGIIGYIGNKQAQSILLNCLSTLEYRGYDSCGIAVTNGTIDLFKDAIRVAALQRKAPKLDGKIGIGHTRWATHGEPSQTNAHPHIDCSGNIAVVHNGVINNYQKLKQQLIEEGHNFTSETDTEVIPHLIEKYYDGILEKALESALCEIEGSYSIIAIASTEAKLVVARKESPLVIGVGDRENFISSDVPGILAYTNRVIYLEDGDIGIITAASIAIKQHGIPTSRDEQQISWTVEDAQTGGYEHFMLKEIHEQPKVIRDSLTGWTSDEPIGNILTNERVNFEAILILACGTSYYAGLIGKYITQELLKIPVITEIASEFDYLDKTLSKTIVIAITQSGETADTLRALRKLKETGCRVIAITNVVGSTASRIVDWSLYTRAGPEISIAATKSFTAQLMALYWLMMSCSKIDPRKLSSMTMELRQLPSKVQQVLDNEETIIEPAEYIARHENVFFIGRGINFPVALEGALKLKEVSYIHAEGYAAGELKHGPFALLGTDTPVIAVVAHDSTYEAMITNIKEVKARGSTVIALVPEGDGNVEMIADSIITAPAVESIFSPVINTVALQLLAYYAAKKRGCPIDFPRNLAKSVTVE